ncbi:MAG: type 4 pilus major pilin [Rhodobacteraceae bacterium]|nr:type 4 pilus major pilin [Paracoccaceae bacterium]
MKQPAENPPSPAPAAMHERGATLIEVALFTVIALGIVIGGIVFFEQASTSAKTTESVRTLASLQYQVRSIFQSQTSFGTADLTDLIITSKAVPTNMLADTDSDGDADAIMNEFGGTVTATGATNQFKIALTRIPVDVCSRIVPFDSTGAGLIGTGIASVSDGTATDTDGLAAADAGTFCSKNASGGLVTLTWVFNP